MSDARGPSLRRARGFPRARFPLAIRVGALLALSTGACSQPPWIAPPVDGQGESAASGLLGVWARADEDREARFRDALHPGALRAERRAALSRGGLDAFREQGGRLFALDAPWDPASRPLAAQPLHLRAGRATPDATRCLGCHHVGGEGGGGGFGDSAFFDADGDDALTARRRLPRMLAGAGLLERAAAAGGARVPFGWAPGRASSLREMVRWSIATHLGAEASDEEVDALTAWIALLPPPVALPPPRDSLVARAAHGAELFRRVGCADCHVDRLPVEDPVLRLGGGRRIDLRYLLSPNGQPPFEVAALSDLLAHRMGPALAETGLATPSGPGRAGGDDRFVTAPLWGLASRGLYLHDGRAPTVVDAIEAHGGEAQRARERFAALGTERSDLLLYLATLGRAPTMTWAR